MSAVVTLRIKNGKLAGTTYEFDKRHLCPIGRGRDCEIRLPDEPEFESISRHHCLLDIDPPKIRVHDSSSLNGTSINGMQIGRPKTWHLSPEMKDQPFFDYDLTEGDELKVGHTVFQVSMSAAEEGRSERREVIGEEKELCACG